MNETLLFSRYDESAVILFILAEFDRVLHRYWIFDQMIVCMSLFI